MLTLKKLKTLKLKIIKYNLNFFNWFQMILQNISK